MGHSVDSQVFKPLGHHQPTNKKEQLARVCPQTQRQKWYEWKIRKSRDCKFAIP